MILYIFNNYFPDNSGFVKRCKKEIEILSSKHDITILCRRKQGFKQSNTLKIKNKVISIIRYGAKSSIMERTNSTYKSGFYEIKRNLDLLFGLLFEMTKFFIKNRKNIKIYAVTSPLTIPLFAVVGKLFGASLEVIEFHDLEPELAMHIKRLDKNNLVVRIEFFLEKLLCRFYRKVVVTNQTQANRIIGRTGIDRDKVLIVPNSIQVEKFTPSKIDLRGNYNISKKDFVVGYISNFSYDYTIEGLIRFLKVFSKQKSEMENIKILLVGDGDGLSLVRDTVKELELSKFVIFTGRVKKVNDYINMIDAGIIPWTQNILSETILPTKLFEYIEAKKSIIIPDFGEFKPLSKIDTTILLNKSENNFLKKISMLKIKNLRLNYYKNVNYRSFVRTFYKNCINLTTINYVKQII